MTAVFVTCWIAISAEEGPAWEGPVWEGVSLRSALRNRTQASESGAGDSVGAIAGVKALRHSCRVRLTWWLTGAWGAEGGGRGKARKGEGGRKERE